MKKNYEQGNSLWKDARRRLCRNRAAMAALIFLVLMTLACFVLPLFPCIANPNATNLANKVNDAYIKGSGDDRGVESYGDVCDLLVSCGVRAIWNFAPVHLQVPDHVIVQSENLAVSLTALRVQMRKQKTA